MFVSHVQKKAKTVESQQEERFTRNRFYTFLLTSSCLYLWFSNDTTVTPSTRWIFPNVSVSFTSKTFFMPSMLSSLGMFSVFSVGLQLGSCCG